MKNLMYNLFGYDKILNGIVLGLFLPISVFALLIVLFESLGILQTGEGLNTVHILRPRTLALLALCINVLFMNLFNKMKWYQSMRGVTIATFICVVLWLVKYYKELW